MACEYEEIPVVAAEFGDYVVVLAGASPPEVTADQIQSAFIELLSSLE